MAVQMEYEKDVKVAALDGKKSPLSVMVPRTCMLKTCVTQVVMSSSVYVQGKSLTKQKKMDLTLTQ